MLACESRRIDTLRTEPKATCMRIIESDRAGPPAPGSLLSGGRASEPSTRMLLPVKSEPLLVSAASAVAGEGCAAGGGAGRGGGGGGGLGKQKKKKKEKEGGGGGGGGGGGEPLGDAA